MSMVGVGWWLDEMTFGVFANHNDPVILSRRNVTMIKQAETQQMWGWREALGTEKLVSAFPLSTLMTSVLKFNK